MAQKIRADALAFEQGLAESREKAKSLIMAARILLPDGSPVPKPGHLYAPEIALSLAPGKEYVSRGAYKLLTILDGFQINVHGLACLDAGASTGGFTDCLLRAGARKVYAVDVGTNQLHEKLKADSRVVNLEGVNLRSAPLELIPEHVDFLCGDVSFISLTHILPTCDRWLKPGGLAALLIKPQFELSPREVPKGVVKNPESRQKAVDKILAFCVNELDWEAGGVLPAQIRGPKGNQEYMALFQKKDREAVN